MSVGEGVGALVGTGLGINDGVPDGLNDGVWVGAGDGVQLLNPHVASHQPGRRQSSQKMVWQTWDNSWFSSPPEVMKL